MWRARLFPRGSSALRGRDHRSPPSHIHRLASLRSLAVAGIVASGCALHLVDTVSAGELPREPVRLSTRLIHTACTTQHGRMELSPDLALGLLAFNSPYLFGGRALRSQLTCAACHAPEGPSGAAVRLRLRAPVPDLGTIGKRVDVASFVSQAVEHEFDGPPLAPRTARALAALVSVLAPYTSPVAETCVVDGRLAAGSRLAALRRAPGHGQYRCRRSGLHKGQPALFCRRTQPHRGAED